MLDTETIRRSVAVLGWTKAMYAACLVLLFARVISFDQCLVLVFIAWGLEVIPSKRQSAVSGAAKLLGSRQQRSSKSGTSAHA